MTSSGRGRRASAFSPPGVLAAVQDSLQRLHLCLCGFGGVDGDNGGWLEAGDADRGSGKLPREGDGFRAIVNGGIALFAGLSHAAVNQMQLVAVFVALYVVAENGSVGKTELLSGLLADVHPSSDFCGAVTLREFIRVGIGFDARAELLGGHEIQILDVVGVDRTGFRA